MPQSPDRASVRSGFPSSNSQYNRRCQHPVTSGNATRAVDPSPGDRRSVRPDGRARRSTPHLGERPGETTDRRASLTRRPPEPPHVHPHLDQPLRRRGERMPEGRPHVMPVGVPRVAAPHTTRRRTLKLPYLPVVKMSHVHHPFPADHRRRRRTVARMPSDTRSTTTIRHSPDGWSEIDRTTREAASWTSRTTPNG